MIKYRLVNWQFNTGAWANAVRDAIDINGADIVSGVMGASPKTVALWNKMKSGYEDFPYPNMTNFINFCNNFDIDPREFFILEDK